ncbi:OstA-like protein [Flavobacterium sp.]|uniref:OstA-like protein n=1 Tax=Flavobacterium sp. TaxID=239 RepID=UPI003450D189
MKKKLTLIGILLFNLSLLFAQKTSKIEVEYSDFADVNQVELPDALLLTGNVRVSHDGIIMTCNKAYYYQKENYIKAFGDVEMIQGDTLTMTSKYAEYNGAIKKAYASGNVVMDSPESTLTTDTIYFDRNIQEVYFNSNGTIVNKNNTLKSKAGRYYVKEKKYQFLSAVELKNPEYTIKSNHLDYKTTQGNSVLKGPSTIVGKETFIYTENGHYNSKKNTGYFLQKSYIKYKDRLIEGDSLYYDRKIEYAAGTNNVKITDSINKAIVKGHYGEVFKQKDSVYITKHASIRFLSEKDSMFIHAKKIFLTGKTGERVIRGQKNVRFYKTDLSGKCDSIHSDQKKALTQLIGKPILWNFDNQLTGDLMHLIGNNKTEKIDSLKVLNNSFIISKDTVGTGYNQVKGLNLYSKFKNNKIYETDVVKNAEVIFYMRNDAQELIGINKSVCSKINMIMDDNNKIETITLFNNPDGDIFPEKDLPENARLLRGFEWRGDERIKSKDDIYPADEVELHNAIVLRSKEKYEEEKIGRDIEENKLKDKLTGDDVYNEIFKKYNNRLVRDKNNQLFLVKNFKFKFSYEAKIIDQYKKKHPKYKDEIKIDTVLWDFKSMQYGKYDGGLFYGEEVSSEIEYPKKEYLTYEEIFELYDGRIIIDKNSQELLVKNGKFNFPTDRVSFKITNKESPNYRKIIRINQALWDWKTMQFGKYYGDTLSGNEKE